MGGFRVRQIDHVELFVPDRELAAGWYGEVLGLEVATGYADWAVPGGPLMLVTVEADTKLALFTGDPQGPCEPVGLRRLAFATDAAGFLAFLARLEDLKLTDRTGEPVGPDDTVDHGRCFSLYFTDPWGNRLELTSYDHDELAPALA